MNDLGFNLSDKNIISHLVIGGIAGSLAAFLVYIVALIFGGSTATSVDADIVFSVVIIAIPVAVLEELCYRGYLMTRMGFLWGQSKAILLSAIFFSLVHFNWWSPLGTVAPHLIFLFSVNLAVGGIVLGTSYYMSGKRIWVPIGFHFAWNVLAYALFPVFPDESAISPEIFQIEWGIVSIIGFLFGLSLIFILLGTRKEKAGVG